MNYEKIFKKIEHDQKCKPTCITGPRGLTGPTGPLFKSSNRIIINHVSYIKKYNC